MDVASVTLIICFFGWIPILSFGKAVSMIIEAFRHTTDINVENVIVNAQNIESLDEDIIDKIILNNTNKIKES